MTATTCSAGAGVIFPLRALHVEALAKSNGWQRKRKESWERIPQTHRPCQNIVVLFAVLVPFCPQLRQTIFSVARRRQFSLRFRFNNASLSRPWPTARHSNHTHTHTHIDVLQRSFVHSHPFLTKPPSHGTYLKGSSIGQHVWTDNPRFLPPTKRCMPLRFQM